MSGKNTDVSDSLRTIIFDFVDEYAQIRKIYESEGIDANAKEQALQGMVNLMQLQQLAIQNYANFRHVVRREKVHNKK